MAIVGNDGKKYSYESDELIQEVREDIMEFGEHEEVIAFYIERSGIRLYTNYDFDVPEDLVKITELQEGEHLTRITLKDLLDYLEKQNEIF